MGKAVYAGSFNPFTKGHLDIVVRGLRIFDEIVIGIGENVDKPESFERTMLIYRHLSEIFSGCERVKVAKYRGLTAAFAERMGARTLLRGVRTVADFEYERTMADANRALSGLDTVILTGRPELSYVSSSMVRELRHFDVDTSEYEVTRQDVDEALGSL